MKIGFIDYFLDEWHANNYPAWIKEHSNGAMEVAYAYGKIASPISGKTSEEWCAEQGVQLCSSIEEVVEKSDALVVLSPDNCEMHEELCQVPLSSGKPTFIDKTFSPDLASAKRMFALAEKHGTPCYTTSSLRYADEYANVVTEDITSVCCWGSGDIDGYAVHMLEPLVMLMKAPAKGVLLTNAEGWYQLTVSFVDGRFGSIAGWKPWAPYQTSIKHADSCETVAVESDFFQPFIAAMVKFFDTREVPVAHEETLRIMAIRDAAMQAENEIGEWIAVPQ
ncbi:MAG: Gfo/Idh/MocA family oxidoreductase [Clostridia bacterium]|nr:Gfo/Idh/MocA family oxidoreductase [Clostridia bacterium]